MEIRYQCNRCNTTVMAILTRVEFKGKPSKRDGRRDHQRLDCPNCHKFIKFIGENELSKIVTNWKDKVPKNKVSVDEKNLNRQLVTLEELGFKLDLIIDHLGIKA